MKRYGRPEVTGTDLLRTYPTATKRIGIARRHETSRWLNNRVENSHQPFGRRERAMVKFRRAESLQKFVSIHASVDSHFNQKRHLRSRQNFKNKPIGRPCRMVSDCCLNPFPVGISWRAHVPLKAPWRAIKILGLVFYPAKLGKLPYPL